MVCGSNAYGFFVKFLNSDWMHPIVFPPVVIREIKKARERYTFLLNYDSVLIKPIWVFRRSWCLQTCGYIRISSFVEVMCSSY